MNISEYLAHTKKSVAALADLADVPLSSLYRWKAEEEEQGFVTSIDGENLRKLVKGTKGEIVADDVIGASRKKKAG